MTRTHFFMTLAAACHLALVVCGAAHQRIVDEPHPVGQALRFYGAASGSDSGYGFFAPGVAGERRVVCILTDANGHGWSDHLEENGVNQEVKLRSVPLLLTFSEPMLADAMAASMAAKMFGRWPNAVQVVVRGEVCECPTMQEYQKGERPTWILGYEAIFNREENDLADERD